MGSFVPRGLVQAWSLELVCARHEACLSPTEACALGGPWQAPKSDECPWWVLSLKNSGQPDLRPGAEQRQWCLETQQRSQIAGWTFFFFPSLRDTFPHLYSFLQCLGQKLQLLEVLGAWCACWRRVLFLSF